MATKKLKGLGRGLDALLGGDSQPAPVKAPSSLKVDQIQAGKYQPRTRMDETSLSELAASIKTQGIMQPVLVRPLGEGAPVPYEIIAGERRFRAALMAGLDEIPELVRDVDDQSAAAMALIENIQREDLNPLEEATGLKRLIEEFGMTHAETAEALGRSRTGITNTLRLLELAPPVQELMREGRLDMGHARALLALPALKQIELAREAVAKQLSVRQVEARVSRAVKGAAVRARPRTDRDVARLEEEVSQRLGTTVKIRTGRKGRGKLIVHYASLAHLDQLLAKLH